MTDEYRMVECFGKCGRKTAIIEANVIARQVLWLCDDCRKAGEKAGIFKEKTSIW